MADRYEDILEAARASLIAEAELNEGEPCWCPLWWWEEQTGPTEGEHTALCDKKRELLDHVVGALGG